MSRLMTREDYLVAQALVLAIEVLSNPPERFGRTTISAK